MDIKICTRCNLQKVFSAFPKNKRSKDGRLASCRECTNKLSRNFDLKQKIRIFTHYCKGNICCECCGEKTLEFLTIDHKNNDGSVFRKNDKSHYQIYRWIVKNKYPDFFRVLCINCNFAIGIYGYCPHVKGSLMLGKLLPDDSRSKGERHRSAKLTENDVREIRKRKILGESPKILMNEFGINESSLYKLCKYKTWKNVK